MPIKEFRHDNRGLFVVFYSTFIDLIKLLKCTQTRKYLTNPFPVRFRHFCRAFQKGKTKKKITIHFCVFSVLFGAQRVTNNDNIVPPPSIGQLRLLHRVGGKERSAGNDAWAEAVASGTSGVGGKIVFYCLRARAAAVPFFSGTVSSVVVVAAVFPRDTGVAIVIDTIFPLRVYDTV